MLKRMLKVLTAGLILGACVPTTYALAAPTKGVGKTCPDGSRKLPKQPCPTPTTETPTISIADATVAENAGTVTLTVTRSASSTTAWSYTYATSNVTATSGSDYTGGSAVKSVSYSANQSTFTIPITNDVTDEGNETFTVSLSDATGVTINDATATVTIVDDDDTPPPPPDDPPTGGTADEPAESLEGYTYRTVTDFTYTDALQASWGTGAIPPDNGTDVVGAFRIVCGANTLRYSDHILYFGEEGKSHLHDFNGNKNVTASSTFASLLAAGESSCNDMPGTGKSVQRSSYWIPALLDGGGNVRRVNYVTIYYKRIPKTNADCGVPTGLGSGPKGICIEIPNGLKAITGMNPSTGVLGPTDISATAHRYFFCTNDGKKYQDLAAFAAGSPSCATMSIIVEMPTCWDGQYLWKTDRSHLVYPHDNHTDGKKRCPTTNPYLVTTVSLHYNYSLTGLNFSTMKLASDYMDPTKPRGWSLHADMHIVWDARVKKMFHDNCIDRHLNCSGGDLGNGLQLKGASQPRYGWTNPNMVEDEPDMPPNMVMP